MTTLYANPYDITATGFYFESLEDYQEKAARHRCEEFEIEFIDGSDMETEIAKAFGSNIGQGNVELFFDVLEEAEGDDNQAAAFVHLLDKGNSVQEAYENMGDSDEAPIWSLGTAECFSEQALTKDYLQENSEAYLGELPEIAQRYFDWDSYARDCLIDSFDWIETRFGWFLFHQR